MAAKTARGIDQLSREDLVLRLEEAEETLQAIRAGAVDAVVVSDHRGHQVFTLKGADHTYRVLMQEISEGAISMTEAGAIVYANPSFARICGRPLSEIPGRLLCEFVVEEDWPVVEAALQHAPVKREVHIRGAQRRVPVLLSLGRLDAEGVKTLCAVVTDLTEQKRAQQIIASEQFSRTILEQAPEIVIVLDAEGRLVRASGSAARIAQQDCTGKPFESAFILRRNGGNGSLSSSDLNDAARRREKFDATLSVGLESRIVQVAAAPLVGEDSGLLGCVLSMADVTERKKMEEALRESEERRALATEAAGIGTWHWDLVNRKMIGDEKLYQLFGVEEFATTVYENFGFVHQEDRDRVWNAQIRAIRQGVDYNEEFRVVWQDGSVHWLAATGRVHRDEEGQPVRFMGAAQEITEKKQWEETIRTTSEQLRMAIDSASMFTFRWDILDDRVYRIDCTHPVLGDTGPSFDTLEGVIQKIHSADQAGFRARLESAMAHPGIPYTSDYRVTHPDGSIHWLRDWGKFNCDGEGRPISLQGLVRDVTVEKMSEAALRESEERLQQAMVAANAGSWKVNLTTGEFLASDRALELHGLQPGTPMTHERALNVVHPDDRGSIEAALRRTAGTGEPFRAEYRVLGPNGAIHWIASLAERRGGNGKTTVVGLVQNITERKRNEEHLEERNRQLDLLARSAQRLLVSADPDQELEGIFHEISGLIDMEMFYHYRPSGEPRTMSLAMAGGIGERERELFGTMRFGELLCGRVAEQRENLIVEDLQHSTHPGSDVLRGAGATSYAGFPLVANGELIGTLAFISARRTHLPEGAIHVIQAICDQTAMAIERARLLRDLRAANEDLSRYAYAVAHDLREPIRNIGASSQMLTGAIRGEFQIKPERLDKLQWAITEGVERIDQLLADLLMYSKAGEAVPEPPETDMNGIMHSVRSTLKTAIEESGAEIVCDPLPAVRVRETEMTSLLQNLIGNAIKYRRKEEAPRIRITAERRAGEWLISVRDNGEGIDPEFAGYVFGMFKRLHTRDIPGTGIGLAICEKIVTKHGGRIWVDSEIGKGSNFQFTWPVRPLSSTGAAGGGGTL